MHVKNVLGLIRYVDNGTSEPQEFDANARGPDMSVIYCRYGREPSEVFGIYLASPGPMPPQLLNLPRFHFPPPLRTKGSLDCMS